MPNASRNGQKCPKMQQNPGSYTRESWVSHVCDWHVYQSLDVIGKSKLVLPPLFYMDHSWQVILQISDMYDMYSKAKGMAVLK